jgi:signal recognition particle receptor subunit beta
MYDAEQRMKEIMDAPQLSAVEKSKLYSDQLNRFLIFKNKMDVPTQAPVQRTPLVSSTPVSAESSNLYIIIIFNGGSGN